MALNSDGQNSAHFDRRLALRCRGRFAPAAPLAEKEKAVQTYSWEGADRDTPEQFLAFSKAYLRAARVICRDLIENPDEHTYENGCACMFNARLSVELFLKATLFKANSSTQLSHDIDALFAQFKAAYVGDAYAWHPPFIVEVLGASSESEQLDWMKTHKKEYKQDQALRYPRSRDMQLWQHVVAFSATEFQNELNQLASDVARLESEIFS